MNDLTACYNNISLFSSLASRILSSEEGSVYGGPSHSLLYNTRYARFHLLIQTKFLNDIDVLLNFSIELLSPMFNPSCSSEQDMATSQRAVFTFK